MLEQLIESLVSKASIELEIKEAGQNSKYIESIKMSCDQDVVKECLGQIEAYLLHQDLNEINKELEKLEYYTVNNKDGAIHFISLDSYNSSPLVKLLIIRKLLISNSLYGTMDRWLRVKTGSWIGLAYDDSIKLTVFRSTSPAEFNSIEQQIEEALHTRLALSGTNYFAFRISNGTYTEPYILKISNGTIQEVICSTSGHKSTRLHSYLWEFIKNNNPTCKINSTLPLIHNGDCTRYADYALIQFQYLAELHDTETAFSLLSKNKPYEVNQKIFRDFQMFSSHFAYNPLKKIIDPLPENIANQISSKSPIKTKVEKPDAEKPIEPTPIKETRPEQTIENIDSRLQETSEEASTKHSYQFFSHQTRSMSSFEALLKSTTSTSEEKKQFLIARFSEANAQRIKKDLLTILNMDNPDPLPPKANIFTILNHIDKLLNSIKQEPTKLDKNQKELLSYAASGLKELKVKQKTGLKLTLAVLLTVILVAALAVSLALAGVLPGLIAVAAVAAGLVCMSPAAPSVFKNIAISKRLNEIDKTLQTEGLNSEESLETGAVFQSKGLA